MASFISMTDLVYPVGAMYFSANSTSPGSLFGGNWTQLNDDRYIFTTSWFGTGGSWTHNHQYGVGLYTSSAMLVGGEGHNLYLYNYSTGSWVPTSLVSATKNGYVNTAMAESIKQHNGQMANVTTNTSSATCQPPYRACYCWYRTS